LILLKLLNWGADCFIPEFWVTRYPPKSVENQDLHCMVGFMAGEPAAAAAAMRPSEVVRQTLAQLDRMFGASLQP
jgi:monoamine oxidase